MLAQYDSDFEIPLALLEGDTRWQAVQRILASPGFVKAPRMRALLSFLMKRKLSGMEGSISEYAIGIEVFRRAARDYDTAIDPIVRVQMSRLRDRLARYYARSENTPDPRIVIPLGSYVPMLTPAQACRTAGIRTFELAPLRTLSCNTMADAFTAGLEEELTMCLFQLEDAGCADQARAAYRVEVSLRVEPDRARACVRLVETATGHMVWLQRCDVHGDLGIEAQEALARDICSKLQAYLERAGGAGTRVPDR